jgi:hypothetical protein
MVGGMLTSARARHITFSDASLGQADPSTRDHIYPDRAPAHGTSPAYTHLESPRGESHRLVVDIQHSGRYVGNAGLGPAVASTVRPAARASSTTALSASRA